MSTPWAWIIGLAPGRCHRDGMQGQCCETGVRERASIVYYGHGKKHCLQHICSSCASAFFQEYGTNEIRARAQGKLPKSIQEAWDLYKVSEGL